MCGVQAAAISTRVRLTCEETFYDNASSLRAGVGLDDGFRLSGVPSVARPAGVPPRVAQYGLRVDKLRQAGAFSKTDLCDAELRDAARLANWRQIRRCTEP